MLVQVTTSMSEQYTAFTNPKRRVHNGSQAESSVLKLGRDSARFTGYQTYSIGSSRDVTFDKPKMIKQWELVKSVAFEPDSTVLDLGCSNGAFGTRILLENATRNVRVTLLDHDFECIENMRRLRLWSIDRSIISEDHLNIVQGSFGKHRDAYDYVITLSTIHWFYSATSDFGCLFEIIALLRSMTRKALIIEWVQPSDGAIHSLGHIHMNKLTHKTPYSLDNFLEALRRNFTNVEMLGQTTATRQLYRADV
jgi:hypothetical protein